MTAKLRVGTFLFTALAACGASASEPMIPPELWHLERADCVVGHEDLQLDPGAGSGKLMRFLSGLAEARAAAAGGQGQSSPQSLSGRENTAFAGSQVVYLEFNPGAADFPVIVLFNGFFLGLWNGFPDYVYTQEDKDYIQARLEESYALYDIEFTQERPEAGGFTTLSFGDNDFPNIIVDLGTFGLSILFGRAENIDFRNKNSSDNAFVDSSFWQFLSFLDPSGVALAGISGIPVADPGEIPAVVQQAVRIQSANTGAHELGHILGLRHHDSIGAPGFGLPPALPPEAYLPVGETEQNAEETLWHIMASGASVGLPIENSTTLDRFFAERSAVKLALNGVADLRATPEAATGGRLGLTPLDTPNPLVDGLNAGLRLNTVASLVEGSLDAPGELDVYRFSGTQGQVFNAELISFSDLGFQRPIVGLLVLGKVGADGSVTELVRNRFTFEGPEPMIIDFELPESGEYALGVSAPDTIDFGPGTVCPDGTPSPCSLEDLGLGGLDVGDYDLHAYIVDGG